MRTLLGLALAGLVAACNPAELAKLETAASTDFAAGCSDWQAVQGLAGEAGGLLPSPFNQAAAITEAFVGDACTDQSFIRTAGQEQVDWIDQSTANLTAVVTQASTPPSPATQH